jgi:hypothetical protein
MMGVIVLLRIAIVVTMLGGVWMVLWGAGLALAVVV